MLWTKIKKVTIVSITVYAVGIVLLLLLYRIDTREEDIASIKEFIQNESSLLFDNDYCNLSNSIDSYFSSREIISDYVFCSMDYSVSTFMLGLVDGPVIANKSVRSMDDAKEFVDNIIPDGVNDCNPYVRTFIRKFAYYDLLETIDPDVDCYYEIRCYGLEHINLYSGIKWARELGILYDNMFVISGVILFVLLFTLAFDIEYLAIYYAAICKKMQ